MRSINEVLQKYLCHWHTFAKSCTPIWIYQYFHEQFLYPQIIFQYYWNYISEVNYSFQIDFLVFNSIIQLFFRSFCKFLRIMGT